MNDKIYLVFDKTKSSLKIKSLLVNIDITMRNLGALVVKLVDTKDLKSLPLAECQFESGRGHH